MSHPWVDPNVGPMDDAALLRPDANTCMAYTVDFITPIVDDPEQFGAIAAANSLSDVYAMGGEPQVALAICGFPEDEVPLEILARILKGGADKAAEANCAIVGGHTVIDPELKYGLCVIGSVPPDHNLSQTGAEVGDRLVLSKPIGAGIAAQAIKKEQISPEELAETIASLTALNRGAKDAALAAGSRAATDVTGFGLLGHLHNLVLGAGHAARLFGGSVPLLSATRRFAEAGLVPGGSKNNLRYVEDFTHYDPALSDVDKLILADAQTSGGLLIAVKPENEARLLRELAERGSTCQAVIGEVTEGTAGSLEVIAGTID